MTITTSTTQVYVRVDLASRRVLSVSDQVLVSKVGAPVYPVAANYSRPDYYVVEDDTNDPNGISVRAATSAEITAADQVMADETAAAIGRAKYSKAFAIKDFYDNMFISRFMARGFMTTTETLAAKAYTGSDTAASAKQVEAVAINNAYNEWRYNNCQAAIDAMKAAADLGVTLDDEYRTTKEDELDTLLTANNFDITIYHR